MSHFLVITDDSSYERSTVYGIFETLEAAREHVECRTAGKAEIERQSRENRKKSPGAGDPGPYVDTSDYGVDRAEIQQWDGPTRTASWERDWKSPLNWQKQPEYPNERPTQ